MTYLDGASQGAVNVALTIPNGSVVKSGTLLCVDAIDFDGGGRRYAVRLRGRD